MQCCTARMWNYCATTITVLLLLVVVTITLCHDHCSLTELTVPVFFHCTRPKPTNSDGVVRPSVR